MQTAEPDGQPRRMLDTAKAKKEFGFEAKVTFEKELKKTIDCCQRKARE